MSLRASITWQVDKACPWLTRTMSVLLYPSRVDRSGEPNPFCGSLGCWMKNIATVIYAYHLPRRRGSFYYSKLDAPLNKAARKWYSSRRIRRLRRKKHQNTSQYKETKGSYNILYYIFIRNLGKINDRYVIEAKSVGIIIINLKLSMIGIWQGSYGCCKGWLNSVTQKTKPWAFSLLVIYTVSSLQGWRQSLLMKCKWNIFKFDLTAI